MAEKKYKCGGKMKYPDGGFLDLGLNVAGQALTGNIPGALITGISGAIGLNNQNRAEEEAERERQILINKINMQNSMQSFTDANKMYTIGGSLDQDKNITEYNGLPHDFGGLPLTDDIEVEDNETRGVGNTEDYIFSDSLQPDPKKKKTFADISKDIEKKYKGYENDKIAMQSKDKDLSELMFEQESLKQNKFEEDFTALVNNYPEQIMKMGGGIHIKPENRGKFNATKKRTGKSTEELTHSKNPLTRKRAIFAQNAKKWHHEFGGVLELASGGGLSRSEDYGSKSKPYPSVASGDFAGGGRSYPIPTKADAVDALRLAGLHNRPDVKAKVYAKYPSLKKGLGGPIDPPDGGDKRYLTQEEYDAEVAKRKAAYDKSFNQFLSTQGTGQDLDNPQVQSALRSQYEQMYPLDLNDIAVKKVAPSGFDYTDKTWIPNSAAISKYKELIDAGKVDEANQTVLGHFQIGKGGGRYNPATHGEAEKLGNVKPIRLGDVGEVLQYAKEKVPDIQGILDNMKYGGYINLVDGGPIDPPDKKKRTTEGIKDYTPEQLEYHRQVLRKLYELDPKSGISNYPQYALQAVRNPQLFGQPEIRSNFTTNPQSITWNPNEGNPVVAYISPDIPQSSSDYTNRPRVGLTAQEFKSNPDFYKNVLGGSYGDVAQYVLGQPDINVSTPGQELKREDVLNMVNTVMSKTPGETISFAYGGPINPNGVNIQQLQRQTGNAYGVYNQPFTLDPTKEVIQPPVDSPNNNTQQYTTNPEQYTIQYNPNYQYKEPVRFADYQGQPKLWTNDNQFIYTKDNIQQALLDKGLTPGQIRNFFRPGYAEQFFDELAQNPQSEFSKSQFRNDRRFGPEHMLAVTNNKGLIPSTNTVPPIESLGPPSFDYNPEINPQLLQSGNPPQLSSNPPGIEDGGYGNLRRFRPDLLAAGLSALPSIGMGIGNLNLANNLDFQQVAPEIAEPDYVDPTRAIQEVRDQYAGVKDVARQVSGGSGNLMSNLIGATSSQAKATAGIASQYDNINAGISNQFEQFNVGNRQQVNNVNAQIANQEERLRTQLKQQGYENLVEGLAGGIGTYYDSKRYADQMNIAGGENFYYRTMGPSFSQTPVKVFRGNGYHYYNDPDTGEIKFLHSSNGKEVKDPKEIDKYTKDLNKSSNKK